MRLLWEGIRVAFQALAANKLRTFLTLLGNIVGIMAVIAVVSLLRGIDNYVRENVAEEGSNVVTIQRIDFFKAITDFDSFLKALRHNPPIRREDVAYLREHLTVPSYVSGEVSTSSRVSILGKYMKGIEVRGRDERYPFIEKMDLYAGRHLSQLEVGTNAQAAVIGWEVYEAMIKPHDPMGRTVKIGRRHFRVVGVVEDLGSILGQSRNRFVVIPLGAYRKLFGGRQSLQVKLKTKDIKDVQAAVEEARFYMRLRHRLKPGEEDDFALTTSEQLIDLWKKISGNIMVALVALVGIAMVVGGVVLMNTMLVSVTERTREVGIRKALGARRTDIVWQFMVESATLSLVGGGIGMGIGFLIAILVSALTPLPYSIDPFVVGFAFALTILVGVVFGTYPAVKAATLDPVAALRYE